MFRLISAPAKETSCASACFPGHFRWHSPLNELLSFRKGSDAPIAFRLDVPGFSFRHFAAAQHTFERINQLLAKGTARAMQNEAWPRNHGHDRGTEHSAKAVRIMHNHIEGIDDHAGVTLDT